MPLPLPDNMVEYLKQYGVKFVVVGHTPHGNAPTVIMHDGVTLIMGDTSFSHDGPQKTVFVGLAPSAREGPIPPAVPLAQVT